jgi:hypothetical protein
MTNFYEMTCILSAVNEISASPHLDIPAPLSPPRSKTTSLMPDENAQRIIPLMISREVVLALLGLKITDPVANEVLTRIVQEDEDPSNPVLLSHVSNAELKAVAAMAGKILRWAVSKRKDDVMGAHARRLEEIAEKAFDALERAEKNAANVP